MENGSGPVRNEYIDEKNCLTAEVHMLGLDNIHHTQSLVKHPFLKNGCNPPVSLNGRCLVFYSEDNQWMMILIEGGESNQWCRNEKLNCMTACSRE